MLRLLTLAICLALGLNAAAAAQTSARPAAPKAQLTEERVRQLADQRITEATKGVLDRADRATSAANTLLTYVTWVSVGWLAVVTLLFGALALMFWQQRGLISAAQAQARQAATAARTSADQARSAEQEIIRVAEQLRGINAAIEQSLREISAYVDTLPRLEARGIVGDRPAVPSSEQIARLEEADIVIVVAEKARVVEAGRLVEGFVSLGRYWKYICNYTRAIARFKKALEIDPGCRDAKHELCACFYNLAREIAPMLKEPFLAEAEAECNSCIAQFGKDHHSLFNLGWIADEREHYDSAVEYYLEARQLDRDGQHTNITYNLACSYAKWGQYEEALHELSTVIRVGDNLQDALRDPDFERLRADETFGPRFHRLAEETRAELARG